MQHTERRGGKIQQHQRKEGSVVTCSCQPILQKEILFRTGHLETCIQKSYTAMPTLHMYQLLDKELPAILMAVLMTLTFLVVLAVIFLKRCSSDDKGRMAPLVFIETIELYFPEINKEISKNEEEIEVYGKRMSHQCFGIMPVFLIPIIVGTIFITFWNVYLVEESVGGNCEANFDCFPKNGDDYLQQEPVSSCSMFEFNGSALSLERNYC